MKTVKNRNNDQVDMEQAALTMAVAILVERIRGLPKEDREDLFELAKVWFAALAAENEEEAQYAAQALQEILDKKSGRVIPFVDEAPLNMEHWLSFVSHRIKEAREQAGLTQEALEAATGLPQSHISRLENGVHSPSSATLEKIAKATGKSTAYFDPSHQDEQ